MTGTTDIDTLRAAVAIIASADPDALRARSDERAALDERLGSLRPILARLRVRYLPTARVPMPCSQASRDGTARDPWDNFVACWARCPLCREEALLALELLIEALETGAMSREFLPPEIAAARIQAGAQLRAASATGGRALRERLLADLRDGFARVNRERAALPPTHPQDPLGELHRRARALFAPSSHPALAQVRRLLPLAAEVKWRDLKSTEARYVVLLIDAASLPDAVRRAGVMAAAGYVARARGTHARTLFAFARRHTVRDRKGTAHPAFAELLREAGWPVSAVADE